MKTVAEALQTVLDQTIPLPIESVPLIASLGRRLAAPIVCPADVPPFDKSMMDGFAVRTADTATIESTGSGVSLRIVGEITAGSVWNRELQSGETVRIMTGAPVPVGADAVIPLERVSDEGDTIVVDESPRVGWSILNCGELMRQGAQLLAPGVQIRPQEIALLAEIGQAKVAVHQRPTVAVLATGDELVPVDQPLGPGQIRNSNEPMLLAQIASIGSIGNGLGIARDEWDELISKVREGLNSDILLLSGGVSMGSRDLVPQVFASLGIRELFHKVQLKPGKPIWFGLYEHTDFSSKDGVERQKETGNIETPGGNAIVHAGADRKRTLIFGLPGNPVSSMVCFELFVRPAIQKMLGSDATGGAYWHVPLAAPHQHREDRPTCFPATLRWGASGAEVVASSWKGSADLRATTEANGLIHFPPGNRLYVAGEMVEFHSWESS